MKATCTATLAAIVALTLAGGALAQGRHDERPHGYAANLAAQQKATPGQADESGTVTVTPAVGPRAQDNPLRFAKIKVPKTRPVTPAGSTAQPK